MEGDSYHSDKLVYILSRILARLVAEQARSQYEHAGVARGTQGPVASPASGHVGTCPPPLAFEKIFFTRPIR